jgi:hypothetical protein
MFDKNVRSVLTTIGSKEQGGIDRKKLTLHVNEWKKCQCKLRKHSRHVAKQ